jgi:acetyltransferase-like isoleucine patch superfamily enzyme
MSELETCYHSFLERGFELRSSVVTLAYTWLMRRRFAGWGKGSRLKPPATLHQPRLMDVGRNVFIREHAWLVAKAGRPDGRASLIIGDGTYIGRFAHINAWRDVVIEPEVLIADRVFISDADHHFADRDVPIRLQGDGFIGSVRLCSGCWIGIGAVIMPGVTIGRNSVVIANGVVTRDVPAYTIVGGIPAKVVNTIG